MTNSFTVECILYKTQGIRNKRNLRVLRAAGETEPCKKISKIGCSWMKENQNFSFQKRETLLQ
jgi:hypothetical protein